MTKSPLSERTLFWQHGNSLAARSGEWKLIVSNQDKKSELYNLKTDISETNNIANEYPLITEKLYNKLNIWQQEVYQQD